LVLVQWQRKISLAWKKAIRDRAAEKKEFCRGKIALGKNSEERGKIF